jgi:hypothetical protein
MSSLQVSNDTWCCEMVCRQPRSQSLAEGSARLLSAAKSLEPYVASSIYLSSSILPKQHLTIIYLTTSSVICMSVVCCVSCVVCRLCVCRLSACLYLRISICACMHGMCIFVYMYCLLPQNHHTNKTEHRECRLIL